MKKHMLKETNSMRRLMGLSLLKEQEEIDEMTIGTGIEGNYSGEDKDEDIAGAPENKKGLKKFDSDEIFEQHDDGESTGDQGKDEKDHGDVVNEDSEGEETYNYGEDEGADEHREDEMEDELHHDKEDMAPHDRIKAIEDHLDALKKDMGYDEDHEDRDEEGTHFAEGKRYSKVLNTLTESQYRKLKRFINEGPNSTPNVIIKNTPIKITDGNGAVLYEGEGNRVKTKPSRFDANEIMTITIPGLMCDSVKIAATIDGKGGSKPAKCEGDKIMINVSDFGTEKLQMEGVYISGNVDSGTEKLDVNMSGSSVKGY